MTSSEAQQLQAVRDELRDLARQAKAQAQQLQPEHVISRAHHGGELLAYTVAADKIDLVLSKLGAGAER